MSYLQFARSEYKFRPTWLGTLITVCCIPLFIKLGLWQYHKAEQKQALQHQYDSNRQSPPVPLPLTIAEPAQWRYKHVRVEAAYMPQYQILLDNQVDQERAGYHVITPARIVDTDTYVLVDRGWVPASAHHADVPRIETPSGTQQISGQLWLPAAKFYTLQSHPGNDARDHQLNSSHKSAQTSWQTVWQNMDMKQYARLVPFSVLPLVIRLDPESTAGGFVRHWPLPAERISNNLGYAYQWFGFAVAALLIYVYISFRKTGR